jgi:predicted nucleic acid-binding protein
MSINYTIQAEVINIQSDSPKLEDTFLVDTNVWCWQLYSRASRANRPPRNYQITDYPSYIQRCLSVKSLLCYSGFSLAELAHLIETAELDIFNGTSGTVKPKEYRHNYLAERARVVAKVQSVWSQIKQMAVPINLTLDESITDAALNRFQTQSLDGYDLFILETMKKEGIVNVITDDGDFVTVPTIRVFTANHNVISAARNQDKLVTR